ncbi:MAG: protein-tyrosine-phosphatase [Gammaproteobacteria bacterium HGW-Gammaproteobacteria-2]|nr:MAG: protein-tyrosine-phosphatase [Gammaproteobacteria bacterium HGW-Gammaproteobacteria-2]
MTGASLRVLFVCMGNICRSPLAEGIARHQFREQAPHWQFDSAGTGNWHCGEPPDKRAIAVAADNGIDISGLRARQIHSEDFDRFDLILCADHDNLAALQSLHRSDSRAQCDLLLRYAAHENVLEVPDPYYGGNKQFAEVFLMLAQAMPSLRQRFVHHLDKRSATMRQ